MLKNDIIYEPFSTDRNIDPRHLDELFEVIGWRPRGAAKWKEVLGKTSFLVSAWEERRLVGFGRLLEDGAMCMFYDIGVHPTAQKKGVGSEIMRRLIEQVQDKHYASIGLFAWEENPNNIPFYQKFGFESVRTGMELVRYMVRE